MKNLSRIVPAVIVFLVVVIGFVVWQKSQVKPVPVESPAGVEVKKVDLSTQPEWVRKLNIKAVKGRSANGLENVTIKVNGLVDVQSLNYVLQYQTTNKGAQGVLSTKPVEVGGATFWTKVIDLGTCSTKSCVRHDGVTVVDLELDFTTSSGDHPTWTGTLSL